MSPKPKASPTPCVPARLPHHRCMQEFVQRVHALGVVRKRVMPFRLGQARGASCRSTGG